MNRRNLIQLLALLPVAPAIKPAAAQIDIPTANYLRQWDTGGAEKPANSLGASARPWDVQRAFEVLSAAPRAPHATPFDTAVWFKDLKDTSKGGEPFNGGWAQAANPVITGFFAVTSTVPQDGNQTSWCAAFVNWCLAAGRKNISFSATAQSFRWDREKFPSATSPELGDLVVFGALDGSRIGHVGFLSRPLGTPDPKGEGTKGVWIIGGNQKAREEVEEEKGAVTEKFYPEDHPALMVLDIVKTTDFPT
jgi:CHAP domain-containing protein